MSTGTLFLWLFWPSFNGALAASTPSIAQRCIANTIYSIVGSTIASFALSSIVNKENKLDMVHIQNSTLAGGVAAGAVANLYISPMGALMIGTAAGILSVVGYKYITPALARAIKLHDTCGVHNLHGMPGILSAFVAVVVARLSTTSTIPEHEIENIYPRVAVDGDFQHQANMQMAGVAVTLGTSIVGGILTGLMLRAPIITATEEEYLFDDKKYWIVEEEDKDETVKPLRDNMIPLTAAANGAQIAEE